MQCTTLFNSPCSLQRTMHYTVHCAVHYSLHCAPCSLQSTIHCTVQRALCSAPFTALCQLFNFHFCSDLTRDISPRSPHFSLGGLSNVQSVVCIVQSSVCNIYCVQYLVCSVQFAVCSVKFAVVVCSVQCAVCSGQCAVYSLNYEVCGTLLQFLVCLQRVCALPCWLYYQYYRHRGQLYHGPLVSTVTEKEIMRKYARNQLGLDHISCLSKLRLYINLYLKVI